MKNEISFRLWGRQALFTDPITKIGGEKFSYPVPTYEALRGVCRSIYWKPTFIWHIDKVRIVKPIRTQSKSMKPLDWNGGNTLAIYTYLQAVEYQVLAHFEWNAHQPRLQEDRNEGKHYNIAKRMLEAGGRQDIFLGVRDCQGYVEPCEFGTGDGFYDAVDNQDFGLMFHSFAYPDETGKDELHSRFWRASMQHGVITFPRSDDTSGILKTRFIRKMARSDFAVGKNVKPVEQEEASL